MWLAALAAAALQLKTILKRRVKDGRMEYRVHLLGEVPRKGVHQPELHVTLTRAKPHVLKQMPAAY